MPRTEVYQLRLTPAEKAKLGHLAMVEKMSIARMIRKHFGLSSTTSPPPSDDPVTARQKAEAREAVAQGEYEVEVKAETSAPSPAKPPPAPEPPSPEPSTEDIEALARQIFYGEGQTMAVARRIARERLS